MSSVAIITARGGSKRIPRKNIKEFCGRPIMEYSIKAAIESGIFDEVMVSTDDREISEIAVQCGAMVPFFRSEKTGNDYATTADVLKEVFDNYHKIGKDFEYACCIYPTAPFITASKLKTAMKALAEKKADTVMPVVAYSFPPQRAVIIDNGLLKPQYPEYQKCRSQDLEPIYHDCGQFYCISVQAFQKSGLLIGERTIPIVVDEAQVQDIDTLTDWRIAEMKYKLLLEEKGNEI